MFGNNLIFFSIAEKPLNVFFFQGSEVLVQAAGTDLGHRTSSEDSASFQSSRAGILHDHIWHI